MNFGAAYYPDYFPESDWARDLDAMHRAGIRTVRILEFGWCWYQPAPDVFRFDPLDRFLGLCLARTIAVCLSTPTATPPPWFFQKYPDARLVDVNGRSCYSHRHMTCWQQPEARAEAFRTIETLVARYGRHPAVTDWQIDNEPNYAEDISACYDFNPHALRAGQAWLAARYGTLEALNASWFNVFWSQAFNEWEQVWVTHRPQVNPGSMLDFLRWRDHAMAEFVHAQAALLRRHAVNQRIGVNIPETGVVLSTIIGQDYWAQAAGLDWIGTDLYTATSDRAADLRALRLSCDLMRSVRDTAAPGAAFLIAETQGGPHMRNWASGFAAYPWEPGFLRDSVNAYAERGAESVWYFLWRPVPGGQEIGMNATTDLDGGETEYSREIARIATDSSSLSVLAASYSRRPLALVHYSRDTARFLYFFKDLDALARQHQGAHAWLDDKGYRIHYVTDADLEKPLPAAALLVLPESHLLSDHAQDTLLAWAAAPGAGELILGPHTGLLDERGQLRPPSRPSLLQRLGLRPGKWSDQAVHASADGRAVTAYRTFLAAPEMPVSAWLEASSGRMPALYKPAANISLYTHRWCEPAAQTASAASIA